LEASCIILAGGKSSRLGKAKSLEIIGSKSLLERVLDTVSPLCKEVLVVIARGQGIPAFVSRSGIRTVVDVLPGKGPLVGVYSGINESASYYNLVVANDMPFLNRPLLNYMLEMSDGYDLTVPKVRGQLEPLHAVYSRKCLQPIREMIEEHNLSVNKLARSVNTRYLDEEEIDRFDPDRLSFFNINTKADLDLARELAERGGRH
jgi:molybdopterin-guanine dinucleotide biosynthesis protein A